MMNQQQGQANGRTAIVTRVLLQNDAFQQALERHVDENKPDPLQLRQMQSWVLEWTNDNDNDNHNDKNDKDDFQAAVTASSFADTNNNKDDDDDDNTNHSTAQTTTEDDAFLASCTPTHVLSGRLKIQSDYVTVTLHSACWWREENDDDDHSKKNTDDSGDGGSSSSSVAAPQAPRLSFLVYQCQASAQLNDTPPSHTNQNNNKDKKAQQQHQQKPANKIHQKMIQRLSADDYIAKLLVSSNNVNNNQKETRRMAQVVCQARILCQKSFSHETNPNTSFGAVGGGGLEERVNCIQDVAEGIRRAIFSQADSTLDVFDLLVHLPSLPCSAPSSSRNTTTRLANRAKLRLLEDAMCDACEQEGEEELVQQLELQDDNDDHEEKKPAGAAAAAAFPRRQSKSKRSRRRTHK